VQKGYTSSIAVYVDQSGSVGDGALELLFGELRNLARQTEFTIFNFDSTVDESSERVWKRSRMPGADRTRFGGTCFKAVTEHANKHTGKFDGYLILSDGEAPDPGPSKLKRGWVIVPNRDMSFEASKRDFVIKMKNAN
jgi:predicted metal-dependent peptidase